MFLWVCVEPGVCDFLIFDRREWVKLVLLSNVFCVCVDLGVKFLECYLLFVGANGLGVLPVNFDV